MTIPEIKQQLESNLQQSLPLLQDVAGSPETLANFFSGLLEAKKLTPANTTITLVDNATIKVETSFPAWELPDFSAARLRDARFTMEIDEKDGTRHFGLGLAGVLQSDLVSRTLALEGRLSNPESVVLDLKVASENGFGFDDFGALVGMNDLRARLQDLGVQPPAIRDVVFGFNLSNRQITYFAINGAMTFGDTTLEASAFFLPDLLLTAKLAPGSEINLNHLLQKFQLDLAGFPALAVTELNLFALPLSGTLRADLSLAGEGMMLTELAAKLLPDGASLPDEIPQIRLSKLTVAASPALGAFTFGAELAADWNFPLGEIAINVEHARFEISRGPSISDNGARRPGAIGCLIEIAGAAQAEIAQGVSLQNMEFAFALQGDREWNLSGSVRAGIFDEVFDLEAGLTSSAAGQQYLFNWQAESPVTVLRLAEVAELALSSVQLAVSKPRGASAAGQASWQISGSGEVDIKNVFSGSYALTLQDTAEAKGVVLLLQNAKAGFELPFRFNDSGQKLGFEFRPERMAIIKTTGAQWAFEASCGFTAKGLPRKIDEVLADDIRAKLHVDGSSVLLAVSRLLEPAHLHLPDIEINNAKTRLGDLILDIANLRIVLGRQIEATADFGLGLPKELNNLFGVNANGSAKVDLFQTFNPADPAGSVVKLRMGLTDKDFTFTPLTSPLKAIALKQEGGASWWYCKLGEFGEIKFKVPVLKFDGASQSFEASGGFMIVKALKLPLTPLKQLLTACKLEGAAKLLPDGVPIEEIKIVDQQGNFKVNELITFLERAGQLPGEVKDILKTTGTALNRLPQSFTEYLNFSIPDSLFFDISVAGGGNVKFSLRTYDKQTTRRQDAKPIRLIFPGLVQGLVPMPGFNGIQLRSISFGPLSGGSLFLLQVDGIFDQFDIATLAASLALPTGKKFPLPASDQLQRRIVLEELFMIIVYQTAIPIPIPIFYDNLGLEFLGIEGVGLQTHIRFPQPEPTLSGIATVLSNLIKFFSDQNFLLDARKPPQGLNLRFTLGTNSIQLPEYLGGALLGKNKDVATLDVYENLAHLLNGLKTLTLNELIQVMPLDYRVGAVKLSFFTLSINCSWAITTPKEFVDTAYQRLQLPPAQREGALQILPRTRPQGDPQGLVIFLKGGFDLKNVVGFQSMFGLVASGPTGFGTGFLITGTVANFVNVKLAGAMVINPAGGMPFSLNGKSELKVANQTVMAGALSINDKGLFISGAVDLFPGIRAVTAKGNVTGNITKDGFGLSGNVDLAAGGVTIIKGSAEISHAGIAITGKFLGISTTFSALEKQKNLQIAGGIKVSVPIKANIGPISAGRARVADRIKLDLSVSCAVTSTISKSGFMAGVSASPSPRVFGQTVPIAFTLSIVPADIQALAQGIVKEITNAITQDFKKFFGDAEKFLANVGNGIITFSGNTVEAAGKVLKGGYNRTTDQAARLLKGAGYVANDVGKALKGTYTNSTDAAAKALKGAGYAASDVGNALKGTFTNSADVAAKALKGAGYVANDVGKALKGTFTNSADVAAKALKGAGYVANDVGKALKGTFTNSTDAAAKALKGAGYTASQVGDALKGTFTNSVDTAAKALKSAGYAASDVAKVMKNTFGASAKKVAQFMKDTWGMGDQAVNGLLKGAGYAASEIKSVMKSLFGWFKDVFNPSNW